MEEIIVFVILKKKKNTRIISKNVCLNLAMEVVNDNVQLLIAPLF